MNLKNKIAYMLIGALVGFTPSVMASESTKKVVSEVFAVISKFEKVAVILGSTKDGEGYVSASDHKGKSRSTLTPGSLSMDDKNGNTRIIMAIDDDKPMIIFYNSDGSLNKIIQAN